MTLSTAWLLVLQLMIYRSHFCWLRTENRDYNSHRITKIRQREIKKALLGLMSPNFCCGIWVVGSKFDTTRKHCFILPCNSCSGCCWCNSVCVCLGGGDFITRCGSLKHHSQPVNCFWPYPSLYNVPFCSNHHKLVSWQWVHLYSNSLHNHQISVP